MLEVKSDQHIKQNYDGYYDGTETEWRRLGALDKSSNIISLCRGLEIDSLIDIGAGDGAVLSELAKSGFAKSLYAIEISKSGVDRIRSRSIPQLVECQEFDGYSVPYEDGFFDLAILSHVIEHVEHPRKLIYESSRVAKYIYVEVPLEDNLRLSNDFVRDKVGHINFFSLKTIRRMLQSCDLEIVGQIVVNPSKEVYSFQGGHKGMLKFYLKQAVLSVSRRLAASAFTYNAALLCKAHVES
jgi:ubiquinone/menaquinone biosynthesis C-methylase UbiE